MTFLGQAAITAPTRTTARALLVTAALLLMIRLGWVEVDGLTVFEATLAEGQAEAAMRWLVVFLILAHVVQWYGDFASYRAWNIPGAEQRQRDFDGRRFRTRVHSAVEEALRAARAAGPGSDLVRWSAEMRGYLIEDLRKMNDSMGRFSRYAIFYVWVWYLLLPMVAGFGAVLWSLHG